MNFRTRPVYRPLVAALAAAGLLGAGAAGAWSLKDVFAKAEPGHTTAAAAPTAPIPPLPAGSVPDFSAIVRANGPAVVGVTVAGTHKASMSEMPDDPFFQFFRGMPGFQFGPRPARQPSRAVPRPGLGLHRQRRRPDPDQRARRARRQGGHRQAQRPARVPRQGAGRRPRRPTSRCCASTPRTCRPCGWATRELARSATRCWPSARPTASSRRRPRASSAPRAARCPATPSCPSSRPTPR